MRAFTLAAALAATLAALPAARAQSVDDTTKNAARSLATEGDALFADGKYAEAADRFERASALVPAPTLAVRWARALAKLGKLIAAEERYVSVVRATLPADAPDAFRAAVSEATAELVELRARIPRLAIVRAGAGPVALDGQPVPPALLGVERPVDPGKHVIEAEGFPAREITLAEGDHRRVALDGPAGGDGAGSGAGRRTAGWVGIGVGGVALGVGVVAGIVALGKNGDLEAACDDQGRCPQRAQSDIDGFQTAGSVSTVGFVIAGVALAAGTVLLVTSPSARSTAARLGRRGFVF